MTRSSTQTLPDSENAFAPVSNDFLYQHIALSIKH